MEVPKASRGGRSYLSLSDAGQAAGEMPVDVSGTSKVPGLAVADRPLNAYAAASITPDAGGVTPPFTARTSISNPTSMDYRSKQLALLGPLRPQPTKVWKRKFVKLMVVGDSGLGKTTLISALLSKPGEQLQVHDGTNTPLNQFLKDPDSLITRVTWKDEQDKVVWVFRVQDTPGYGDDQDISRHIGMIVQHINTQNTKWLDMESARDRCAAQCGVWQGAGGWVPSTGRTSCGPIWMALRRAPSVQPGWGCLLRSCTCQALQELCVAVYFG
eukprot:GHRQ01023938.1.p1 GENE.GHRQ01023938.1~~GHRQ01023938.1.p1  ORF type:complete len:271 (+),score=108.95 GHRQ01023938.1:787-1599(+)